MFCKQPSNAAFPIAPNVAEAVRDLGKGSKLIEIHVGVSAPTNFRVQSRSWRDELGITNTTITCDAGRVETVQAGIDGISREQRRHAAFVSGLLWMISFQKTFKIFEPYSIAESTSESPANWRTSGPAVSATSRITCARA